MGGSDMDAFAEPKAKEQQQQEAAAAPSPVTAATTGVPAQEAPAAAAPAVASPAAEKDEAQKEEKAAAAVPEKATAPVVAKDHSKPTSSGSTSAGVTVADAKAEKKPSENNVKPPVDIVDAAAPAVKLSAPIIPSLSSNKPAADEGAKPVPVQQEPPPPAAAAADKKPEMTEEMAKPPPAAATDSASSSEPSSVSEPAPPTASESTEDSSKPKLKYAYKEDQWSPINLEGKKQYDRDFLLQLRKDPQSMEKPSDLPNMEIVRDKPADRAKAPSFAKIGQPMDWMPSYVKPTMSKVRDLSYYTWQFWGLSIFDSLHYGSFHEKLGAERVFLRLWRTSGRAKGVTPFFKRVSLLGAACNQQHV